MKKHILVLTLSTVVLLSYLVATNQVQALHQEQIEFSFNDTSYGYRFSYPQTMEFKQEWNSGANHVVEFSEERPGMDNLKFYVVIENFDTSFSNLEDWLEEREQIFIGQLSATRDATLDGISGLERIYETEGKFHLARYYLHYNKIYLLNIGPLNEVQALPSSFDFILYNFQWLTGNYKQRVPTKRPGEIQSAESHNHLGPPTLQFPFCGSWRITNGYYYQNPGHANSQYSRYAIDWVNNDGATFQEPIYAAHSGNVTTGWDSTGGGNTTTIVYDSDSNYHTVYLHLYDFTVTSGFVASGTQIARADCTGTSCSDHHLHFTLRQNISGQWWSILPEPMSGITGFAPGQVHTRNCTCCGCVLTLSENQNQQAMEWSLPGQVDGAVTENFATPYVFSQPLPALELVVATIVPIASREPVPPVVEWVGATAVPTNTLTTYHLYWGTSPVGTGSITQTETTYSPEAVTEPGTYYLRVAAEDEAGQMSEWQTVAIWQYDPTPPTGTLTINNGSETVPSLPVTLQLDTESDVADMRFSTDGLSWTEWEAFSSSRHWQLADSEAEQTVYARVRDEAGNVSEIIAAEVTAVLGNDPPSSANYTVACSSMNAGGGTVSSNNYTVQYTIGQVHETGTMSGGNYQVHSGFWGACGASIDDLKIIYIPFMHR